MVKITWGEKMNILIIEDEYSLADAVAEMLKKEEFNVCIKTEGEEGEDEALTGNYDLILLDVMLPEKKWFWNTKVFKARENKDTCDNAYCKVRNRW